MVDVAMCSGQGCDRKKTCFRYLAFPDEMQSYIIVDEDKKGSNCELYWRCRNPKELALMNKLNK